MKPEPKDWRDALGALNLPAGTEPEPEPQPEGTTPQAEWPRQRLTVQMERKGRGGKTATIISGFTLTDSDIDEIAAMLKKKLGTGGSARGGEILIQGNRVDDVRNALRQMGLI